MSARKLPVAATLGLLASLAAHSALFGESHRLGGAAHWPLLLTAMASFAACTYLLWRLAASGAACVADGTVLAGRLEAHLPGVPSVASLATLAYAAVEACETDGHSPAAAAVTLLVILAVSWLLCCIARSITRLVAEIAILACPPPAADHVPCAPRDRSNIPLLGCSPARSRLYSRPPPMVFAGA